MHTRKKDLWGTNSWRNPDSIVGTFGRFRKSLLEIACACLELQRRSLNGLDLCLSECPYSLCRNWGLPQIDRMWRSTSENGIAIIVTLEFQQAFCLSWLSFRNQDKKGIERDRKHSQRHLNCNICNGFRLIQCSYSWFVATRSIKVTWNDPCISMLFNNPSQTRALIDIFVRFCDISWKVLEVFEVLDGPDYDADGGLPCIVDFTAWPPSPCTNA